MSKVENSDLTAGGDAPPVEAIKTDCADNTVVIIAVKDTDAVPKDAAASAEEVAKEVLNAQIENEHLIEAIFDTNVPGGEEVTNPDAHTEGITNIITEIVHVSTEDVDVVQVEAQRSAEEADNSAIALQSEETSQSKSANEEKMKVKGINDRQISLIIYNYYLPISVLCLG